MKQNLSLLSFLLSDANRSSLPALKMCRRSVPKVFLMFFFFFFCHSCHTHCYFIKRFLAITSPLSVINENESRNCDERLLILSCAAPAPNSACLPQNKTLANGSKILKDTHLQVMFSFICY